MINGAFTIVIFNGKTLFIKRKDKGLWDLPGGGFDPNEVDYKGVALRELREETKIVAPRESLHLCAILGQKLPRAVREKHHVEQGFLFLHYLILHEEPTILVGGPDDEHTEARFFSYLEVIQGYQEFASGPLWNYFAYLAFAEKQEIQEGMLRDRATWQGKTYL